MTGFALPKLRALAEEWGLAGRDSDSFALHEALDTVSPHPLDSEEIRVEVTHVPTGFRGSAEDDPGTPVGDTVDRALDELLRCLETGGGG